MHSETKLGQDYLHGQLSSEKAKSFEEHCESCESCSDEFGALLGEALKKEVESLENIPEPQQSLQEFHRILSSKKKKREGPSFAWFWSVRLASFAAVFSCLLLIYFGGGEHRKGQEQGLLAKGLDAKMLYSHRVQLVGGFAYTKPRFAKEEQTLYPSDIVQFSYRTTQSLAVMLVGLNQKGEIYILSENDTKRSVRIPPGFGSFPKKEAFELDDFIGLERFFLIYSDNTFQFAEVKKTLREMWKAHGGDLRKLDVLNGPWGSRSFLIRKLRTKNK